MSYFDQYYFVCQILSKNYFEEIKKIPKLKLVQNYLSNFDKNEVLISNLDQNWNIELSTKKYFGWRISVKVFWMLNFNQKSFHKFQSSINLDQKIF